MSSGKQTLTADTDLDTLRERIGVGPNERLRESSRRQSHLQKFARILSGEWDLRVVLNPSIAATRLDEDEDGSKVIYIPTMAFDQPITDLRQRVYDLLCQEVMVIHETGHRLYTDWPSHEELRDQIDDQSKQQAYHLVWNAIEDGAIEKQLRAEFVISNVLHIVNANLSEANPWGREVIDENGEVKYIYSFLPAVVEGLLDLGHHDAGRVKRLLDPDNTRFTLATRADRELYREFVPKMRDVIEMAHAQPDPVTRNHIVWDFWQDLEEYLERAPTDGLDVDVDNVTEENIGRGMTEKGSGEGQPADELGKTPVVVPDPEGEESDDGAETKIGGFLFGDADDEEEEAGGGDEEDDGEPVSEESKPTSTAEAKEIEEEVAQKAAEDLREEAKEVEGAEAFIEEAEEFIDILGSGASSGADNKKLQIPEQGSIRDDIWRQAQALGIDLKRILETTLQHERRDIPQKRRSVGRFDRYRMMDAVRGSPRVFQRTRRGEKKDYSCILVTDRSGSIGNAGMTDAVEISQAAFMWALEALGIDTMAIDFHRGQTRLAKPFGQKVETSKDTLVTGDVGGGTPLGDALFFARRRVERGAGTHPFVIVITDGQAGSMDAYTDELAQCGFPVFGLYVRPSVSRGSGGFDSVVAEAEPMFDHLRVVCRGESIAQGLCDLAYQVVV